LLVAILLAGFELTTKPGLANGVPSLRSAPLGGLLAALTQKPE
jgi:hypothetical protein